MNLEPSTLMLKYRKYDLDSKKILSNKILKVRILKIFLRSVQKWPIKIDKTFFLTHRKTKNPRSKKVPPYEIYGDI